MLKKIISIGNPSLKYLIECLDRPSAIFWIKALESITGRNTKSETFDSIILEWKNWFNQY